MLSHNMVYQEVVVASNVDYGQNEIIRRYASHKTIVIEIETEGLFFCFRGQVD